MKRLACLMLLATTTLGVGCSHADVPRGQPGLDAQIDGVTAGGCECPTDPARQGQISLECLCAEFPGSCPSYDELMSGEPRDSGPAWRNCWDQDSWWLMEQTGCGRLIVSTGPSWGGWRFVYDEATHELVGAQVFSDLSFGSCGASAYSGGDLAECDEGTICSLCDESGETCAPACSVEVLKNRFGAPSYEDAVVLDHKCAAADAAAAPELHVGCGQARLVTMWGTDTYDAETHQLLSVENDFPECGGVWGDPGETCADETVCSLCYGAPNRCQF